jgi:ATP-dependent Clp protease ATP-binding subunit ClpX
MNNTMYSQRISLRTEDISFVACGTFSGFKGIARDQEPQIGFSTSEQAKIEKSSQKIAVKFEDVDVDDIENFQLYGFIPELMGRFTRIVPLDPLDRDTLKAILLDSVVRKFVREFREEGITFQIEKRVLNHIVDQSFKRQTGARGLASILTKYIEAAAFQSFCNGVNTVTLRMKGGEVYPDIA